MCIRDRSSAATSQPRSGAFACFQPAPYRFATAAHWRRAASSVTRRASGPTGLVDLAPPGPVRRDPAPAGLAWSDPARARGRALSRVGDPIAARRLAVSPRRRRAACQVPQGAGPLPRPRRRSQPRTRPRSGAGAYASRSPCGRTGARRRERRLRSWAAPRRGVDGCCGTCAKGSAPRGEPRDGRRPSATQAVTGPSTIDAMARRLAILALLVVAIAACGDASTNLEPLAPTSSDAPVLPAVSYTHLTLP